MRLAYAGKSVHEAWTSGSHADVCIAIKHWAAFHYCADARAQVGGV